MALARERSGREKEKCNAEINTVSLWALLFHCAIHVVRLFSYINVISNALLYPVLTTTYFKNKELKPAFSPSYVTT
jgi:hypothetical protein